MAPVLSSLEPTVLTAGSTASWTLALADFPIAEGWALSYAINGRKKLVWQPAWVTNDGATWTVAIPGTATTDLTAGVYRVTRILTGSGTYTGQRHTQTLPNLLVAADPATQAEGDAQSFAEKMLLVIEDVIAGRLTDDQPHQYAIGGRSVTRMEASELRTWRSYFAAELDAKRNRGSIGRAVEWRMKELR